MQAVPTTRARYRQLESGHTRSSRASCGRWRPRDEPAIARRVRRVATCHEWNDFFLTVKVVKGGICEFSYQTEKISGHLLKTFTAKPGRWVGAKIGLFCTRTNITNDAGCADVDWFRIEKSE